VRIWVHVPTAADRSNHFTLPLGESSDSEERDAKGRGNGLPFCARPASGRGAGGLSLPTSNPTMKRKTSELTAKSVTDGSRGWRSAPTESPCLNQKTTPKAVAECPSDGPATVFEVDLSWNPSLFRRCAARPTATV
jgi:hypothetical protein